jgi:hypothetical protein
MAEEKTASAIDPLKKCRRKRSRYAKISLKTKLVFFRKVVHEGADLR